MLLREGAKRLPFPSAQCLLPELLARHLHTVRAPQNPAVGLPESWQLGLTWLSRANIQASTELYFSSYALLSLLSATALAAMEGLAEESTDQQEC